MVLVNAKPSEMTITSLLKHLQPKSSPLAFIEKMIAQELHIMRMKQSKVLLLRI